MTELTTLVTFLLEDVPRSHSVELIGSWDNFRSSYTMEKDSQKGSGNWTGCYSFKRIICDGDPTELVQGRSGGLKMGGTYWYYYKLDGDAEYHDSKKPTTTHCPMMPGQTVNILEVPNDLSTSDSSMTLDPAERFKKGKPNPKPKCPSRKAPTPPIGDCLRNQRTNWPGNNRCRHHTALANEVMVQQTQVSKLLATKKRRRAYTAPTSRHETLDNKQYAICDETRIPCLLPPQRNKSSKHMELGKRTHVHQEGLQPAVVSHNSPSSHHLISSGSSTISGSKRTKFLPLFRSRSVPKDTLDVKVENAASFHRRIKSSPARLPEALPRHHDTLGAVSLEVEIPMPDGSMTAEQPVSIVRTPPPIPVVKPWVEPQQESLLGRLSRKSTIKKTTTRLRRVFSLASTRQHNKCSTLIHNDMPVKASLEHRTRLSPEPSTSKTPSSCGDAEDDLGDPLWSPSLTSPSTASAFGSPELTASHLAGGKTPWTLAPPMRAPPPPPCLLELCDEANSESLGTQKDLALCSQETIKPLPTFDMARRRSLTTSGDYSQLDIFQKLTEHIQRAYESGRFEEPIMSDEDATYSSFAERELDCTDRPKHKATLSTDSHDKFSDQFSYLGAIV